MAKLNNYEEKFDNFDNEEETYVLTPKGMAYQALYEVGLLEEHELGQFNAFWILFENKLLNSDYVQYLEEDDEFYDEECAKEFKTFIN